MLKTAVSDSYFPFSTKDEDPNVFVGYRHFQGTTSTGHSGIVFHSATRLVKERRSSRKAKYFHARSNISQQQVIGVMKGASMRCVDTAENEHVCKNTIISTCAEFTKAGHSRKLFWRALADMSRRYSFPEGSMRSIGEICRRSK